MPDARVAASVVFAVALAAVVVLLPVAVYLLRDIVRRLDDMKLSLNGKMSQLLHEYGRAQRAEGIAQERQEERARHGGGPAGPADGGDG